MKKRLCRIKEMSHGVYDCGWIFVSNQLSMYQANRIASIKRKQYPEFKFHVVFI